MEISSLILEAHNNIGHDMYREHYQIKMEKRSNAAYEYLLALVAGLIFASPLIFVIIKELK